MPWKAPVSNELSPTEIDSAPCFFDAFIRHICEETGLLSKYLRNAFEVDGAYQRIKGYIVEALHCTVTCLLQFCTIFMVIKLFFLSQYLVKCSLYLVCIGQIIFYHITNNVSTYTVCDDICALDIYCTSVRPGRGIPHMWLSLRFLLSFYLLKGFFSSFSLLLLRVKGRGCHTLLKPYETNCGL